MQRRQGKGLLAEGEAKLSCGKKETERDNAETKAPTKAPTFVPALLQIPRVSDHFAA